MDYLKRPLVVITLAISTVSISHVETIYAETVADKNGLLGVGLDLSESLTLSINGRLKGRTNRSKSSYGFNSRYNNADRRSYDDYRLDLSSFAAMIDWHPGGSGFRVSAGLLHNGKEPDTTTFSITDPDDLVSVHGYRAGLGGLADSIDSDKTAPYLGIGWRNRADSRGGFSFSAEAGVLLQGNSNISLTSSQNLITDPGVRQDESDLEDSLDNVEIYPVLNLGISYTY